VGKSFEILEVLYRADPAFLLAAQIAAQSHSSLEEVRQAIEELEQLGYKFETHPHLGLRLSSVPDRLTSDDIRLRMKSQPRVIGSEILVFQETGSTNDVTEYLARSGAREGVVVFAESQTRGRGRYGRTWVSPAGKGLWFSVLLRPPLTPSQVSRITVAASVAVARCLREVCGVDARIKWPNDVTVNGAKVCGVLTELRGEADEVRAAIVGIGVDVNCEAADLPAELAGVATSLLMATGKKQDRVELAARLLEALDVMYRAAVENFDGVIHEWARLCTTLGKQITVDVGGNQRRGWAQALDGDGALLLRMDNGRTERILGGTLVKER
jgi:BirA family biotin operon repressor/biotin-[acetyl-CoA-carboxylase] ligase